MLSLKNITGIQKRVRDFWRVAAGEPSFVEIAKGKETGHRIADYVDEKTTSFLHAHYDAAFERHADGRKKPRSMGDLWLKEGGIYHPVNIKTGITDDGQPNMVALGKVLKCLLQNQIDAYYLLMVKFSSGKERPSAPAVYFVDMLDYLDHMTFDSGPGQIMLKAELFFNDFQSKKPPTRTMPQKADILMQMLEEGDKKLFVNRKRRSGELRDMMSEYKDRKCFAALPVKQAEFNIAP